MMVPASSGQKPKLPASMGRNRIPAPTAVPKSVITQVHVEPSDFLVLPLTGLAVVGGCAAWADSVFRVVIEPPRMMSIFGCALSGESCGKTSRGVARCWPKSELGYYVFINVS